MQDAEYTRADLDRIGKTWIDRIRAAEKREKEWIDDAELAEAIFTGKTDHKDSTADFNILHSNVETIVPSIYNSAPAPDIRPRHNVRDETGKAVADVLERSIALQIDDNALDREIEACAQSAFLAGRMVARVKFDAEIDEGFDELGYPYSTVTQERVWAEAVAWRDYRFGPCARWNERPWEAFRHKISQEEVNRLQDDEIAALYVDNKNVEEEEKDQDVWEIWDSETRRVFFVIEESSRVVAVREDPLSLSGFFASVMGQPIEVAGRTEPVCPYRIYKSLAEELDTTTRRIRKVMDGLRVRALAAGVDAGDVARLGEADDNEVVFAENLENLAATGGLDKGILWWPVEQSIMVLRELYTEREETKQAIYEITGISDIVRGQGAASETATAQQIKTQWGSVRIRKMQRMIERMARDLFKLYAEVLCQHFTPQTLSRMSGVEITPEMAQLLQKPFDHYRIDVESDSTIRADQARNQEQMSRFLEGSAAYFQTMAPIVSQAPAAAGPAVEIYAAFARQFNLGKQAEDALEQFVQMAQQAAQQPKPNPEAEMAKAEMEMRREKQQQDWMLGIADRMLKKVQVEQDGQRLELDERKAEVDAAATLAEVELEAEQERPVAVGEANGNN